MNKQVNKICHIIIRDRVWDGNVEEFIECHRGKKSSSSSSSCYIVKYLDQLTLDDDEKCMVRGGGVHLFLFGEPSTFPCLMLCRKDRVMYPLLFPIITVLRQIKVKPENIEYTICTRPSDAEEQQQQYHLDIQLNMDIKFMGLVSQTIRPKTFEDYEKEMKKLIKQQCTLLNDQRLTKATIHDLDEEDDEEYRSKKRKRLKD